MNETTTILTTCKTEGCDRPVHIKRLSLCRKCYAREYARGNIRKKETNTPPPPVMPSLPALPASAPEHQRETQRLLYFAAYRRMRFAADYAARLSGYPVEQIEQAGFLDDLDQQTAKHGFLALLDVPLRTLYATQRHKNLLRMIELRDQGEDLRIAFLATKALSDLDLKHDTFDPQEIANSEIADWSKEDLIRFIKSGSVPQHPHTPALQVFVEEVPPDDAGTAPELEPEETEDHPDKGMLA